MRGQGRARAAGGDLCIARQGFVQGMGSGTLFDEMCCSRAGPLDIGNNNNSAKVDSPRY
jgi:hypothetical protein